MYAGIDQALRRTGVVLLGADGSLLEVSLIVTGDRTGGERLLMLQKGIEDLLHEAGKRGGSVARACVEGASFGSVHREFDLGGAQAAVLIALAAFKVPTTIVPPVLVKKFATGNAQAEKADIVNSVATTWHTSLTSHDEADAYVLAQIARSLDTNRYDTRAQCEVVHRLNTPKVPRSKRLRIRPPGQNH